MGHLLSSLFSVNKNPLRLSKLQTAAHRQVWAPDTLPPNPPGRSLMLFCIWFGPNSVILFWAGTTSAQDTYFRASTSTWPPKGYPVLTPQYLSVRPSLAPAAGTACWSSLPSSARWTRAWRCSRCRHRSGWYRQPACKVSWKKASGSSGAGKPARLPRSQPQRFLMAQNTHRLPPAPIRPRLRPLSSCKYHRSQLENQLCPSGEACCM